MTTIDDTLRALAHPARRRIVELARRNERSASELAERVGLSRPAASQHLRALLDARLLSVRADGRRRLYTADDSTLEGLRRELARFWEPRLERLREDAEAESRSRR